MNLGPYGKDAHKRTERLHKKNAFQEMPVLLKTLIDYIIEIREELLGYQHRIVGVLRVI